MNHFWRDAYVRQNYLFRKTEKVKMYLFDTYLHMYFLCIMDIYTITNNNKYQHNINK